MNFDTSLNIEKFPDLITPFMAIAGWKNWEKRFQELNSDIKEYFFDSTYFQERFFLELGFQKIYNNRLIKKLLTNITTTQQIDLYEFIALTVNFHQHLGSSHKIRLEGMFRDALKSNKGLRPLQQEMMTLCHLMIRGFDVIPHDIIEGGGFDFLGRKDNIEIEVDSKTISADVGRKIHRRDMLHFTSKLFPILKVSINKFNGGRFILVELTDKLDKSPEFLALLCEKIDNILVNKSNYSDEHVSIRLIEFNIEESPFSNKDFNNEQITVEAKKFITKIYKEFNEELFFYWTPRKSAAAILLKSKKPNNIADGIYRQLKDSANSQFTKTRPAYLFVNLTDISYEELMSIASSDIGGGVSALKVAANRIFIGSDDKHREYIHTVSFTSQGKLNISTEYGKYKIDKYYFGDRKVYKFRNIDNKYYNDERLDIFSLR